MGKKAKLKKIRKEPLPDNQNKADFAPDQFVKNLEKQGYSFKKIEHSPEIPENRIEPQI
ncbi:hypothetical protein [Gloeothece verrucosa]|uniref:Uncharacterized protein n=1 Tax=Gloeothece verrucosa (strain PCC 7822) TaxID=497965 RepID=E0U681_GLOV7|nr:hypothetical protein [Gloeothece verrucosa]ADN12417.1 conserved hypothetical protein [Gloeothece verrucosa PCC 7822]